MEETLTLDSSNDASQTGAESPSTEVVTGVQAEPAEQQTTETPASSTVETQEKPKQTPEENAKFKALRLEERQRAEREAAQKAVDDEYANLAKRLNWQTIEGKTITTKAEFDAAYNAQQQYETLVNQGKTETEARAEIKAQQLEQELTEIRNKAQLEAKQAQERADFYTCFEELNGRKFDPKTDMPPEEVFAANQNGIPLKYAYAEYFAKQQIQKQKSVETGKQTAEANAANAQTSAGSVTGNGTAGDDFISFETFEAKKSDRTWVNKNYNKIMTSRAKW